MHHHVWSLPAFLFCVFYFYDFFYILTTFPSLLSSKPSPHPLLCFFPKRAGFPWLSTKHNISSCSKSRHLPLILKLDKANQYEEKGLKKQAKEADSPAPPIRNTTRRPGYTIRGPRSSLCRLPDCHFSVSPISPG